MTHKVGILTGGGDCPGLNAVIRAVVRKGIGVHGDEIIGFRDGWRGVLEADTVPMDLKSVRGILPRGGTVLGTSRTNPYGVENEEYDAKLAEAAAYLGDPAERIALFQEAERILVEDVPGVFVYHSTPVQLAKPWVKGEALTPDNNGIASMHWPGYTTMDMNPAGIYITNEVPERE